MRKFLSIAVVAAALACGGDDSTAPSASYENIAGTYNGALAGISQGVALDAVFSLTITQSGGTLGGSSSIAGTLNDGVDVVQVLGTGSLTGTIASGNNPSVRVTVTSGLCPNVDITWSGTYDNTNRVITLNGTLPILNSSCQVVLSYSSTVILTR